MRPARTIDGTLKKPAGTSATRTSPSRIQSGALAGLSLSGQLQSIRARLRQLIANGVLSERRLAHFSGLSQPHVHHLLSGARSLTAPVADRLLASLNLPLIELLDEQLLRAELEFERQRQEPKIEIPLLSGFLGPSGPHPEGSARCAPVPCRLTAGLRNPQLVRAGPDPDIAPLMDAAEFALLTVEAPDTPCDALHAVELGNRLLVRGLRQGRQCTYLLTARSWSRPSEWMRVERLNPVARVIPLAGFRLDSASARFSIRQAG